VIDEQTMHLAIRTIIMSGEIDDKVGEIVTSTNRIILESIERTEGVPNLQTDPRNVENSAQALHQFRQAMEGDDNEYLVSLTEDWTLADYYAVMQETLKFYGEQN